jgi:hypothetical protein
MVVDNRLDNTFDFSFLDYKYNVFFNFRTAFVFNLGLLVAL